MAELEQKYPLDFRYGGDSNHDIFEKLIKEIPLIYNAVNSVRENRKTPTLDADAGTVKNQWYIDNDGEIWLRDPTNTKWNHMGTNSPFFGANGSMDAHRVDGYVFNLEGVQNRQLIWFNADTQEFEPAMGSGDTNFEVVISKDRTPWKQVRWLYPIDEVSA